MRVLTNAVAAKSDRPWLPGLPHAVAALAVWPVWGASACITGLLLATLASFVVYLPLTALALNGGEAIAADAQPPALTRGAQRLLLGLWAVTVWAGAGLAASVGG